MAAANFSVRIDSEVKNQSEAIFNSLGLNLTTAINVFLRKAIQAGGFPFDVRLHCQQGNPAGNAGGGRNQSGNQGGQADSFQFLGGGKGFPLAMKYKFDYTTRFQEISRAIGTATYILICSLSTRRKMTSCC